MRVGLVYNRLFSNVCLSRFVFCSQAYFVPWAYLEGGGAGAAAAQSKFFCSV